MSADENASTTVAELAAFVRRQQAAMREVGRHDLADIAHVVVMPDGAVRLRYAPLAGSAEDETALKALSIDPEFEWAGGSGHTETPTQ